MKPAGTLDSLLPHCQELVREIEGTSGLDIEVMSYSDFCEMTDEPIYGDITDNAPGSVADFDKAFVLYPGSTNNLSSDDYHHELLHLHLKHVLRVPTIVTGEAYSRFAAYLDNQVDHMVIWEHQARVSEEWRRHESDVLRGFWNGFENIQGKPGEIRFHAVYRYFLTREYIPDLRDMVERILCKTGLLSVAHQGWRDLKSVYPDKVSLLRLCLQYCDEPLERYALREIDPQAGSWHDYPFSS